MGQRSEAVGRWWKVRTADGRVNGMGELIEYPAGEGATGRGYLAVPESGASAPALIVIQEWWGLNDQITGTADRLAEAGFLALAPDLYDGKVVPLTEPDEAGKAMMAMAMDTTATRLSGAIDDLLARSGRSHVGVIGFCMGGGLALVLACQRPDAVAAVVPAYGLIPWPDAQPDYTALAAAVEIHAAGKDDYFTASDAHALEEQLAGLGKEVTCFVYEDADHAFFNEDRPEVYDPAAASLLFERALAFFRGHLG